MESDNQTTPRSLPATEHEYDEIRELENPVPWWFTLLFLISILFGIIYFVFYHLGTQGKNIYQIYDETTATALNRQFAAIGNLEKNSATLFELMNKPSLLNIGKTVYQTNCASCHAPDGSGFIGPNLTDDYWKNVGSLSDLIAIISKGSAQGAMPGWENRLPVNELILVSAYTASLRGKNLPGSRGQEGQLIPAWKHAN